MHTKKESMPFSHEFLILLFLKNPDILFLLVRRVHIVNTCHIVHINYIICTGHIVHCLSYRHQPAELLKQIQKYSRNISCCILCVFLFIHIFYSPHCASLCTLCICLYPHFSRFLYDFIYTFLFHLI